VDSTHAKGSAFERAPGGAPVVPNPDRTYGLYAPVARAYFEVRPAPLDSAARAAGATMSARDTVVARVLRPDGHLMAILDSTAVDADGPWAGRLGFDTSTLPAGSYDLAIDVRTPHGSSQSKNRFNVAWRRESWERDPREFQEEAHFLLDDPDLELRYSEATAGEQEAWLDQYWKEKDPTPLTAQNEARDRFKARVQYANDHFSIEGVVKGMFSDRGRIYVRYGEPDEMHQEVIPTGDKSLEEVAVEIAASDDPSYIALRKPGGIGADERPFEIWIYNRLSESEDERLRHGSQRNFQRKFVFVDERGYGDYALKYSTE
jgi:GWxTD domain-containing protein